MLLDDLFHDCHDITVFQKDPNDSLSTGEAIGIGAMVTGVAGFGLFSAWREVTKWTLRDSSTQVPDYDPTTPTPRAGSTTPPVVQSHGETGDPTEFLSPTPTGRVRKNTRARFF